MRPEIIECRRICSGYGAKIRFIKMSKYLAGYCDYENSIIYINNKLKDRQSILICLFHEIAHLICFRENKWTTYHQSDDPELKMQTAIKAEKWCDRWAEMELYKYDRRIKYVPFYSGDTKAIREYLRKYYE